MSGPIEPEVVQGGGALTTMVKAEVDQQVATAKAYPRNLGKFRKTALAMATRDQDTAASMRYTLARTDKDGNRKDIEGPSVRLAEIVASCYGNLRTGARVADEGARFVEAHGYAWDLETNYRQESSHRRRITTSAGRRYSDDMIQTTGNAAASIAFREAVFKVVPRSEVDALFQAARKVAIGTGPIEARRGRAVQFFVNQYQAEPELVAKLAGVRKVEDIQEEQLHTLSGMKQALAEGEATWEGLVAEVTGAMAAEPGPSEPQEVDLDGLAGDQVEASNDARGGGPGPEPEPPAEPASAPEPAESAEVKGDVAGPAPEEPRGEPAKPAGGRKRRTSRRREAPEEPLPDLPKDTPKDAPNDDLFSGLD